MNDWMYTLWLVSAITSMGLVGAVVLPEYTAHLHYGLPISGAIAVTAFMFTVMGTAVIGTNRLGDDDE